jgi:hypothetical protein
MPILSDGERGTESDETKSNDYCNHCYDNGKFTEPNLTVEKMVQRVGGQMKAKRFPEKMITLNAQLIPNFKRWKQGET